MAGLAGSGDRVAAPQLLAGGRIPAVQEAAGRGLAARHPRNQDPVGHDRSARRVVALRPIGELLVPQLFAGLHVEGEDVVVDGHPEEPALVDHRPAAVEAAAPPRCLFEDDRRAPDLPARLQVDGEGPAPVDGVQDPVVDGRRGQLARLVHQAGAPDGHEPVDVGLVDLVEGAVALAVVPHAVDEHVLGGLRVVEQLFRRLGEPRARPQLPGSTASSPAVFFIINLPSTRGRRWGPADRGNLLRVLRRHQTAPPSACAAIIRGPGGTIQGRDDERREFPRVPADRGHGSPWRTVACTETGEAPAQQGATQGAHGKAATANPASPGRNRSTRDTTRSNAPRPVGLVPAARAVERRGLL